MQANILIVVSGVNVLKASLRFSRRTRREEHEIMARAVFLNVSGGGHVIATYGLVAELVKRGDAVVYFEAERYRKDIEALGAAFRAYPDFPAPYSGPMARWRFHHEIDLPPVLCWWTLKWFPEVLERVRSGRTILSTTRCVSGAK
jgi:hypothetical protein